MTTKGQVIAWVRELMEQNEALRKDAARYQWFADIAVSDALEKAEAAYGIGGQQP